MQKRAQATHPLVRRLCTLLLTEDPNAGRDMHQVDCSFDLKPKSRVKGGLSSTSPNTSERETDS